MATLATDTEMEQAAENWLTYCVARQGDWAGSIQPEIVGHEDLMVNGQRLGRVFFVEPNGYVVVPVFKELPPVKFYSDEAWLDLEASQGNAAMYRDLLNDRAERFVDFYGSLAATQTAGEPQLFGDEHLRQWDEFAVSTKAFADNLPALVSAPTDTVGPLMTTEWHQGEPYNNICPIGYGDQHSVVGCVATGFAQIMAYHQWPPEGVGSWGYDWYGDNSCNGSTSGHFVFAGYSDPYDWENIVDDCEDGCTPAQEAAVAELCYEVGVLVNMDYGVCESGSIPDLAISRIPQHFKYKPTMQRRNRVTASYMFNDVVKVELDNNRPLLYVIYSHAIVCDGYRDGTFQEYHMNYGWADNHNAWYVVDGLHCPWAGCSPSYEYAIVGMEPDKKAVITAENTVGWAPLDVQFYGYSDLWVDFWTWEFGDNTSSDEQNPLHTYEIPGVYDVTMTVQSGFDFYERTEESLVVCIADTLWGEEVIAPPGGPLELVICANNNVPLDEIRVPITFSGDFNLPGPDSISVAGCRTEGIATAQYLHYDNWSKRYTCQILADEADGIEPGNGPVLKVYFTVPPSAGEGDEMTFQFDGYTTPGNTEYTPLFEGSLASYDAACNGCVATVSSALDVDEPSVNPIPTDYALAQNYPNPFNPTTRINFALPRAGHVKLTVFNILGAQVITLVDRQMTLGEHFVEWDGADELGRNVSSGTYLYQLEVDGARKDTRKMMLLK